MKKILIILFLHSLALADFLPNDYEVSVEKMNILTLNSNKRLVKKVIKKIKRTFNGRAIKHGSFISINDVWWSKTFNAYAMKYGPMWRITIHGGLLKHTQLTADALSLVICHELGHFLGGAPKFSTFGRRWSSYEGQADYWTGGRCLRKLFSKDDNISISKELNISEIARNECNKVYPIEKDQALCYRISAAATDMAKLVSDISGSKLASLETPDESIVSETYADHPAFQCRVDSYFQASLCPSNQEISNTDPIPGTCYQKKIGSRPQCWFAKIKRAL